MNADFSQILQTHKKRYPLMQIQDEVKLAYQSTYGAEHLAPDYQTVLTQLQAEWTAVPPDFPVRLSEDIGNGFCRFPLNGNLNLQLAIPLLARLFLLTAEQKIGTRQDLEEKLQIFEQDPWLTEYRAQGCPPVHHSDAFRAAYQPHYRLLRRDFAGYFPLFLHIESLLQQKERVVLSIDGRCGSGKSQLANLLTSLFPANVFHSDDYYLPLANRSADWTQTPGGNMDFQRFREEVLKPVFAGKTVSYRPYHCQSGSYRPVETIPLRPLTIIEGSYSQHPVLEATYDCRVFLTCEKQTQTERLRRREGDYYSMFESRWIPLEESYLAQFPICKDAFYIDTTDFF